MKLTILTSPSYWMRLWQKYLVYWGQQFETLLGYTHSRSSHTLICQCHLFPSLSISCNWSIGQKELRHSWRFSWNAILYFYFLYPHQVLRKFEQISNENGTTWHDKNLHFFIDASLLVSFNCCSWFQLYAICHSYDKIYPIITIAFK